MTDSASKPAGVKSAYEAALERLEQRGIERPREDALSEPVRRQIADERAKADARLAELEIMYQDRRKKAGERGGAGQLEEEYQDDRRRVQEQLERTLARLRGQS